jgi:hypothetical protein
MDQGGYGIDQAYLWYRRDGLALAHEVQILAFVHDDFVRMGGDRFLRYGKPVLRVRDGRLDVLNVPVPRTAYLEPWITQNLDLLTSLYTFEVLRRVARAWAAPPEPPASDVAGVALRVFDGWRGYLAAELGRRDIPYLDLVPELRRLGRSEQKPSSSPWELSTSPARRATTRLAEIASWPGSCSTPCAAIPKPRTGSGSPRDVVRREAKLPIDSVPAGG